MRSYCRVCDWSATTADCRDLGRVIINHHLATGHRIDSERGGEHQERDSSESDYEIQEVLM